MVIGRSIFSDRLLSTVRNKLLPPHIQEMEGEYSINGRDKDAMRFNRAA
jgi:hypothetical protein